MENTILQPWEGAVQALIAIYISSFSHLRECSNFMLQSKQGVLTDFEEIFPGWEHDGVGREG